MTEPTSEPSTVTQVTVHLRTYREGTRVVRLARRRGMATAVAYRGPQTVGSPIFVVAVDRPERMEAFLPELRETVPEARMSLNDEEVFHFSPESSLPRGPLSPGRSLDEIGCPGWIRVGLVLGILVLLAWMYLGLNV